MGGWWGGGPCDFSVSPSPFGLDFGTLDFGTSGLGLTIVHLCIQYRHEKGFIGIFYISRYMDKISIGCMWILDCDCNVKVILRQNIWF